MHHTIDNALSLPPPQDESRRDRRPKLGDARLPTLTAAEFDALHYRVKAATATRAEQFARHVGHQLIRRAVRVGAHLGAPVHALALAAIRTNVHDAVAAVGPAAAGIRRVADRIPVEYGDQFTELARILVSAADSTGAGFYRDHHAGYATIYAEASSSVATALALHDRLDALIPENEELRTVIHDSVTGDLVVCEYVRGGKTFAEYRTRRGGTLRVESKSSYRYTRV